MNLAGSHHVKSIYHPTHRSYIPRHSTANSNSFPTNDSNDNPHKVDTKEQLQEEISDTNDTSNDTTSIKPNDTDTANEITIENAFNLIKTFFNLKTLPHVPWGLNTTITVMILWLVGFWFAAYTLVPFLLQIIFSFHSPNTSSSSFIIQQALRHLFLDLTQLFFTILLLSRALSEYNPSKIGLFKLYWKPIKSWLPVVLLGVAFFPGIDLIHKRMVALLAGSAAYSASPPTASSVITTSGWAAKSLWVAVLALLAPLWEEIMFRGFLLPSLSRVMSPLGSILVTSIIFAMVHFTKEGFLPLLLLGLIFGVAYTKTLNLLPAILLHSLWNICLLAQIMITG